MATLCQGYMLGDYIIGLKSGIYAVLFSCMVALCLMAAYGLMGACWLIAKTEGHLQRLAIQWCKWLLIGTAFGMLAISVATPLVSPRVFEAWFSLPNIIVLALIPLISLALVGGLYVLLGHLPGETDRLRWVPFAKMVSLFVLAFTGLAYSFFPYVVPEKITIWEAASARESLAIILVGTVITVPMIIGYTIFAYKVFSDKAVALTYS